jgi:hypothetical protein
MENGRGEARKAFPEKPAIVGHEHRARHPGLAQPSRHAEDRRVGAFKGKVLREDSTPTTRSKMDWTL